MFDNIIDLQNYLDSCNGIPIKYLMLKNIDMRNINYENFNNFLNIDKLILDNCIIDHVSKISKIQVLIPSNHLNLLSGLILK